MCMSRRKSGYPVAMGWIQARVDDVLHDRRQGRAARPLGGYLAVASAYGTAVAAAALAARLLRRPVPGIGPADVALMSASAFQLSRIITRDAVTSPLRAPFTDYEGPAGRGEVDEHVTAEGDARVIGELLSTPYSMSMWAASALGAGMVLMPSVTRLVAGTFTAAAGANFLHAAYDRLGRSERRRRS